MTWLFKVHVLFFWSCYKLLGSRDHLDCLEHSHTNWYIQEVKSNRVLVISKWAAGALNEHLVCGQTNWETWQLSDRWDWNGEGWVLIIHNNKPSPQNFSLGIAADPYPELCLRSGISILVSLAFNIWSQLEFTLICDRHLGNALNLSPSLTVGVFMVPWANDTLWV